MNDVEQLPRFEMLWPLLEVVMEKGGSATIQEIDEGVSEEMKIPVEQQEILHGDGPRTEIGYRLAWCRPDESSGAIRTTCLTPWVSDTVLGRLGERPRARAGPAPIPVLDT